MRLIRQFAVSARLSVVAGTAALALLTVAGLTGAGTALAATAGPVSRSAAANEPGAATASADPSVATPGTAITFQITCGSLVEAKSATFFGSTLNLPEQIPMDRESTGGVFSITVTLPGNIEPGFYHPDMDCSDGSSASTGIRVTALPGQGGAQTGDGTTSTQTNTGLATIGLGLIAVGAVAGGIAMRRRSPARRP